VLELPADKLPAPSPASAPQNTAAGAQASGQPARVYPPLESGVR
jgi:hypothetical protein